MIPKKIHYCWFGGNPLPESAKKYIETWKKYCPDYEIIEWNENNFDVTQNQYCKEAYEAKKWAFVSDYARFWILYKYGGIYFDTDVEVIKPLDNILSKGPFMGCERDGDKNKAAAIAAAPGLGLGVNPGLGLGVNPGLGLYKEMLDLYDTLHFKNSDGSLNLKTVVQYTTETLVKHGLKNTNQVQKCAGIYIYPREYFCPKNMDTGKLEITKNTYTIHHFDASWYSKWQKLKHNIKMVFIKIFGSKVVNNIIKIKDIELK
ncbi:glycosyltransferase [Phascolarctobacterium faecium]|nr:glycosyltransferase [Phascolarctobacterium faecium]MDM8109655.1 glycosyltransferase [Phascolarctobacterium faecium]